MTALLNGGWYLLTENWSSGTCLQVTEDSSLILTDGLTLQTNGIYIQKGKTLTIYGQTNDTGKIVSRAVTGAGIGGGNGYARIEWCTHGDGVEFHDEGRLRVGVCKYCHAEIRGGLGAEPFVIETREGAPSIDARNMADVVGAVLDAEEINSGVKLLLVSSPLSEVPKADRTALEAKASELGATVGQWFDVSLYKDLEGNLTPVHESTVPVALEVEVSELLRAKGREFWLLQCHDGQAQEIASGTSDVLAGSVDRFSTFLIAYEGGETTQGSTSAATTTNAGTKTGATSTPGTTTGTGNKGDATGTGTKTGASGTTGTASTTGTGTKTSATGTTGTTTTTGTTAALPNTSDQTLPAFVPVAAGIAIVAAGVLHRCRQDDE